MLQVGGIALGAAASLAACETPRSRSSSSGRGGAARGGKEAPTLAKRVKAGALPPVKDRLPESPVVVKPTDTEGVYGGVWHTALLGPTDTAWLGRTIGYESLMRWTPDWSGAVANVAESVDASPTAPSSRSPCGPG